MAIHTRVPLDIFPPAEMKRLVKNVMRNIFFPEKKAIEKEKKELKEK